MSKHLSKFQVRITTILERLMTKQEREEMGAKLGLSSNVMTFIHDQFELALENNLNDEDEAILTEDYIARGNGRLALCQEHLNVWNELAAVMGFPSYAHDLTPKERRQVDKVFRAFFAE